MGNWKMNKTSAEAKVFAQETKSLVELASKNNIDIGVAPTFLSLAAVKENADPRMIVCAQNCHFADHGAFTGEISIPMLLEYGIKWVLIGHSERRAYDNETNFKCHEKIKALLENNMVPLYCVGETLDEFDVGMTKAVVAKQIREGLEGFTPEQVKDLVVAYEPVWSIGTGKNASTEIAQDVCAYIRSLLRELFGKVADEIRVLYGGSVKPENIKAYLSCPDIDGGLVGGASLKKDSFEGLLTNIL